MSELSVPQLREVDAVIDDRLAVHVEALRALADHATASDERFALVVTSLVEQVNAALARERDRIDEVAATRTGDVVIRHVTPQPRTVVKKVHRDEDGEIDFVVEEHQP